MGTKRVAYVQHHGVSWSLTPEAWRKLVELQVAGKEWDISALGRPLKRPRSKWLTSYLIDQWVAEDWTDELRDLRAKDPQLTGDEAEYAKIALMSESELLDYVMCHAYYLTDGYYRGFDTAIQKRYSELRPS